MEGSKTPLSLLNLLPGGGQVEVTSGDPELPPADDMTSAMDLGLMMPPVLESFDGKMCTAGGNRDSPENMKISTILLNKIKNCL